MVKLVFVVELDERARLAGDRAYWAQRHALAHRLRRVVVLLLVVVRLGHPILPLLGPRLVLSTPHESLGGFVRIGIPGQAVVGNDVGGRGR